MEWLWGGAFQRQVSLFNKIYASADALTIASFPDRIYRDPMTEKRSINLQPLPKGLEKRALEVSQQLALQFARAKSPLPKDADTQTKLNLLTKANFALISELWESFTTNRRDLHRYLTDPNRSAAAYILGFHLANMIRALNIWHRTARRTNAFNSWLGQGNFPIHIIDVGCGSGAMAQATLVYFQGLGVSAERLFVHGYDRNKKFAEAFQAGGELLLPADQVKAHRIDIQHLDLTRLRLPDDALVVTSFGYVWNEVSKNAKIARHLTNFVVQMLRRPASLVWFVEPANQFPTRDLMALRDLLVEEGKVLYPCPHSAPCPMLGLSRDWCYSEFAWVPPQHIKFLDNQLGLDRSRLSCSALTLASRELSEILGRYKDDAQVIVGRPQLKKSGEFNYLLCGPNKLSQAKPMDDTLGLRGLTHH